MSTGDEKLRLGRPTLTTAHAVGQALAVGPIASVAFLGFLIAGSAGRVAPFAVAVSALGTLALSWTVALYARRYAGAGALYEFIRRAHGRVAGSIAGGTYFGSLVLLALPALFLLTALLCQAFAERHLGFRPPWWSTYLIGLGLVAAIVHLGIRPSVRSQLMLTCVSAVPFVVLAITIIIRGGEDGNTASVFLPSGSAGGQTFRGLLFALLLFGGFESAAALGDEMARPNRSIPAAIMMTIGIAGAFYVLVIYAAVIGFGPQHVAERWGADPAGLSTLADRYVGAPLGTLIEAAVIVDLLAAVAALVNAASRGVFALARDGVIPRKLAAVSRFETPIGGLSLVVVWAMVAMTFAIPFADKSELFTLLVVGSSILGLLVLEAVAVGAYRFLNRRPDWRWIIFAAAAATPALGLYGTLNPLPRGSEIVGIWAAGAIFLIVLLGRHQRS